MSLKPLFPSYLDLGVRPALYDDESMTVLESEAEVRKRMTEVIDFCNKIGIDVEDLKKKKVTYEDMYNLYKLFYDKNTNTCDYKGSWFGIKRPEYSEPGIQGQVTKNREDIELLQKNSTNFEIYSHLCPIDSEGNVLDWTNAIQEALNNGGYIVGNNFKTYIIKEGNIKIPKDKKFILDGQGCEFRFDNVVEDTKLFIITHEEGVNNVKRSAFKNFRINCIDRMRKNICIYLHGSIQIGVIIDNVHFTNMGIGVYLDRRSFGHVITNCYFDYYYHYGIYSKDNSEQFLIQHCWFDYGYKTNPENSAIHIQDITSGTIQNVVIQNSSKSITLLGCRPIVLTDIHLEENTHGIIIGTNNYQSDAIIIDGVYSTSRETNARAIEFLQDTKYAKKSHGTQIRNACFNNYQLPPIYAQNNSEINTSLLNVGYDLATSTKEPVYENFNPIIYISNKIKDSNIYNNIVARNMKIQTSAGLQVASVTSSSLTGEVNKSFNIRWGDESESNQAVYGFKGFSQTGMKLDENNDLLFIRGGVKIAKLSSDGLHLRTGTEIKYDL